MRALLYIHTNLIVILFSILISFGIYEDCTVSYFCFNTYILLGDWYIYYAKTIIFRVVCPWQEDRTDHLFLSFERLVNAFLPLYGRTLNIWEIVLSF